MIIQFLINIVTQAGTQQLYLNWRTHNAHAFISDGRQVAVQCWKKWNSAAEQFQRKFHKLCVR